MKSRVRIYDGLEQSHTTTVEHSELATDDALIEMGRQKLGIARLALREGEVLARGVTDAPDFDNPHDPELATDGGVNYDVVEEIRSFLREDLDRGQWKIYYAKRIAKNVPYSSHKVGYYLGRICGLDPRVDALDLDDPELEIEPWDEASSRRRWRIERVEPESADSSENEALVADGGREPRPDREAVSVDRNPTDAEEIAEHSEHDGFSAWRYGSGQLVDIHISCAGCGIRYIIEDVPRDKAENPADYLDSGGVA
jgi:hypothetical protein